MDHGPKEIMEEPRQFVQSESAGGSSGNTCNNLPLDNARPVAMETTPNPLSYWPPPSSGSPLTNNSKEMGDGPQNPPAVFEHSFHNNNNNNSNWNGQNSSRNQTPDKNQCGDVNRTNNTNEPMVRTSYHNLPPIAPITSSHNYRGIREAQKQTQNIDKPAVIEDKKEEKDKDDNKKRNEEPPKTANSDYVFPVPPVNSQPRNLTSPRAPTPFSIANSFNSFHTQVSEATSVGSPSRAVPSPHFMAPSPTTPRMPNSSAPESPRSQTNPPSPSNRFVSRMPYDQYQPPREPQRPSVPNIHMLSRNNQSDTHCRNPFELPVSKSSYPQPQQQPQKTPPQHFSHYRTNYYPGQQPPPPQQQSQPPPQQHQPPQQPQPPPPSQPQQRIPQNVPGRGMYAMDQFQGNQKNAYLPMHSNNKSNYEYSSQHYQKGIAQPPNNSFNPVQDKPSSSSSKNQNISQRFPPVPQSNYDLQRQIYDRMTGVNQPVQQKRSAPPPQPPPQAKTHSYYRGYPTECKNYPEHNQIRPTSMTPRPSPQEHRPYQYNYPEKQRVPNYPYQHPQQQPPPPQPVPNYNMQAYPMDRNRTGYPQKPQEVPIDYNSKTQQEQRQIPPHNSHNQIPPPHRQFPAPQTRPPPPPPVRPKRESPLDLSVKTVRQSADSTAKDDGDYLQNYRYPQSTDNRYVSQSTPAPTSAPKIDFTPNFSNFHSDPPRSSESSSSSSLPPVESLKKFTKPSSPSPSYPTPKYLPNPSVMEPQKRPINDPNRSHFSQPKIPKVDTWKLAMDQHIDQRLNQHIEQRLNSARMSQQMNGLDVKPPLTSPQQQQQHLQHYDRHSNNHVRGSNMYPQPPVQSSATPYNPSMFMQQPQCQPATPQTPQDNIPNRDNVGLSPDPEQIIKQISKGVMPDHKLLQDKNVLSILRTSLEEKEAKLMQLREAAARKKKKQKELVEPGKKVYGHYEGQIKQLSHSKQCLPPFGAISLERMCAPPSFPGHKLNVPRPLDTVKIDIEPTQNYFSPVVKQDGEKSGIPNADLSPQDDAQGPPDLDGLAAFLAARIRTKAELKQVGPSLDQFRQPSGVRRSGAFTPDGKPVPPLSEPVDRLQAPHHASTPSTTSGSPPKLIRENRLLPPIRRRLYSHTDDETTSTNAHVDENTLPSRDPTGLRSSSETSVFDFRESDSEGEMPVLEKQTLEGMRRDRKTFGSKQNVSTTVPDENLDPEKPEPEPIAELDNPEPNPFWDTAFDMFVEELQKCPPKRSVRKKRINCRMGDVESKIKQEDDKSNISTDVQESAPETVIEKTVVAPDTTEVVVKEEPIDEKEEEVEVEMKEKVKEEVKEEEEKEVVVKEPKKSDLKNIRIVKKNEKEEEFDDSDLDLRDLKSESESTENDDDDSLSISGLESESSESGSSDDSSNSDYTSEDDSGSDVSKKRRMRVQTRLQTRSTRQRQTRSTGMRLRSKAPQGPVTRSSKRKKKRKDEEEYPSSDKKKKQNFGDNNSYFRPGWEEECYKFKQNLRMPEKLINISRPSKRSSVSLPDLDPYRNSPSIDSADVCLDKNNKKLDEEGETKKTKRKNDKTKTENATDDTSSQDSNTNATGGGKKSSTILNLLVNKYGKPPQSKKSQNDLKSMTERKSPRILPKATDKPELLPTPSLGIGKENVLNNKKTGKDSSGKKKLEESDSIYLGYFRRKTVNNFKEAFKEKGGILSTEFSPVVLKSRTRTQTKVLKKRATLLEVFGEERPASAPPLSRSEDLSSDQEKSEKKKIDKKVKKIVSGVVTRGKGKLTRSGRPGLRSAAVLRSNKAVEKSKRHLNSERRKRNMDLFRMRMASKKYESSESSPANMSLPITKKRLKLRSVRRKFRSGFDYIRKKKKLKKDGDSVDGSVKEKRLTPRFTSDNIEDIQAEIKNWVINKGLGETILHRAARLGYTDVAAYCLEKMDCSPSPRDNAGYTPLHEACSRGHLDIAKLLLMYGASVSESAKGGIRPLHEAAENGFTELIRLLLSYGADPLLETYTGHTALSLVSDEEARRLIQHHLADVQGNVAPMWSFQGPGSIFDPVESGYDPLADPPSLPESNHSDYELELSDAMLPPLYRLQGDLDNERWVLLRDLVSYTKAKSRDSLIKQLNNYSSKEMKLTEFLEQSKCCNLLGAGERPITKASKVVLIKYDDKVKQLLGIERIVV